VCVARDTIFLGKLAIGVGPVVPSTDATGVLGGHALVSIMSPSSAF
jgi:hypothetical protein